MKMKIKTMIQNNVEDLFIIGGLFIILGITFHISYIIGFYLLGVLMIGIGGVLSIMPRIRGGDKR